MMKRYIVSILILCASLFLMGMWAGPAAAQGVPANVMGDYAQPPKLQDMVSLFKRNDRPVRLYGLEGPDTLMVGEEGCFTARANVEYAALPLRIRWTFDVGAVAPGLHACHRFSEPGNHPVVFEIANRYSEDADTLHVTVLPPDDVPQLLRATGNDSSR